MGANSVSLDDEIDRAEARGKSTGFTWQRALLLIILFLIIVSDYFVNNIVSIVPGATKGREVTNRGAFVQGICLVLLYALTVKLAVMGII